MRRLKISPEGPFRQVLAAAKVVLTSAVLATALAGVPAAQAREHLDEMAIVAAAELPRQAQESYLRIRQGGPFQHEKDGTVFGNRERMLPVAKRGYYREYTVTTPGARDRGARRIVCGGPARNPQACYYTSDHYASFRKIVE